MKNRTITVSLSADRDDVFAYLADLKNLPEWAPSLCSQLRAEGRFWRGTSPAGNDYFALMPDARTGVVDLLLGAQPDEMSLLPIRVVRRPHGCAVIGTIFHASDCADEIYERCYEALLAGMRGLRARFRDGEICAPTAGREPFYPSLVTQKFFESWDFYTTHLGFRTVCESDVYVHLSHSNGAQIGLLREELDGVPAELVGATNGRGLWLNFDVADADAEQARLAAAGVEIAESVEDKPWGDRQFLVRDPNGVLIAIVHRIIGEESEAEAVAIG